eukprot:scaffold53198_cov27-Prasinocladus_malaysianus.AAC.8
MKLRAHAKNSATSLRRGMSEGREGVVRAELLLDLCGAGAGMSIDDGRLGEDLILQESMIFDKRFVTNLARLVVVKESRAGFTESLGVVAEGGELNPQAWFLPGA